MSFQFHLSHFKDTSGKFQNVKYLLWPLYYWNSEITIARWNASNPLISRCFLNFTSWNRPLSHLSSGNGLGILYLKLIEIVFLSPRFIVNVVYAKLSLSAEFIIPTVMVVKSKSLFDIVYVASSISYSIKTLMLWHIANCKCVISNTLPYIRENFEISNC